MKRSTVIALTLALLAAFAVSACGGPKGFTAKANDICRTYDQKIPEAPKPGDVSGFADYAAKLAPIAREETAKLRALEPPPDQASAYALYLTTLDQQVAAIEQLSTVAQSGNASVVQAVAGQVDKIERRAATQAQTLGLDQCARSTTTSAS